MISKEALVRRYSETVVLAAGAGLCFGLGFLVGSQRVNKDLVKSIEKIVSINKIYSDLVVWLASAGLNPNLYLDVDGFQAALLEKLEFWKMAANNLFPED